MELFEQASRLKVRFEYKGQATVEDLWDIPLSGLDSIFKKLNAELRQQEEESLLQRRTQTNTILNLKVNLIKHIFNVREEERAAQEALAERKAKKQRIQELIHRKKDAELEGLSLEELKQMEQSL